MRTEETYDKKGEVEDVVDMLIRNIQEIMAEVPEGKDRDYIESGSAMVVLVVKKKK